MGVACLLLPGTADLCLPKSPRCRTQARGFGSVGRAGQGTHDPRFRRGRDEHHLGNIDARVRGLIEEYTGAQDKDTWQDVGRRSREILIDLGKLIADPTFVPEGQEPPRGADARAWFDRFLDYQVSGRDRAELRALMRKTWDLAQKVTHGDIDDVAAFAAAQATVLLVRRADNGRTS